MESENWNVEKLQSHEVLDPFPLFRDLFELAQESLDEHSYSVYSDPEWKGAKKNPVELPNKFEPLVADFPGSYYLVRRDNRSGSYFHEGTRFKEVGLSTAVHQYDSDAKLREVSIKEYDASERKGNVLYMTVADRVNESSRQDLNTSRGIDLDSPSGSATVTYEVDATGNKKIVESSFRRLDEAVFKWGDEMKPVRWVRNLETENKKGNAAVMHYRDMYLIGRDENGLTEERASVDTDVSTEGGKIGLVRIAIGIGSDSSARVIFEDKEVGIKVIERLPEGMKAFRNQMDIVKQDPNYAFIFEKPVDMKKVTDFIRSRIDMMEHDWDKPGHVFGVNQIENPSGNAGVNQISDK